MTSTDFIIGYTFILAAVCVVETALIAWLIWLNTALVSEARAIGELLEDTAALPLLTNPITSKVANDHRP